MKLAIIILLINILMALMADLYSWYETEKRLSRLEEELEKELKIEKLEKETEIEKLKRRLNGNSNTNNAN